MKNNFFVTLLLLSVAFSSCISNNYSQLHLVKRKYNKGLHVDMSFTNTKRREFSGIEKHEKKEITIPQNEKAVYVISSYDFSNVDSLHHKESVFTMMQSAYAESKDYSTFKKKYGEIKSEMAKTIIPKTEDKKEGSKKGQYSIISFMLSVVGLLGYALICGTLAIIFGIIGLHKGKYQGLAFAGIVIGLIDVAVIILYAAALL